MLLEKHEQHRKERILPRTSELLYAHKRLRHRRDPLDLDEQLIFDHRAAQSLRHKFTDLLRMIADLIVQLPILRFQYPVLRQQRFQFFLHPQFSSSKTMRIFGISKSPSSQ